MKKQRCTLVHISLKRLRGTIVEKKTATLQTSENTTSPAMHTIATNNL